MSLVRPHRVSLLRACMLLAFASCMLAATTPGPQAADSSSVVVSAEILELTEINVDGCVAGAGGVTDLGPVAGGEFVQSSNDCEIQFGSNDSNVSLRARQTDSYGSAMFMRSRGELDTTFGTNDDGYVLDDVGPANGIDTGWDVELLADGKLLAVGQVRNGSTYAGFARRYLPDGTLDTAWNGGTITNTNGLPNDEWNGFYQLDVQADGRFTVLQYDPNENWVLRRYHANGTADAAFTAGGPSGSVRYTPCYGWGDITEFTRTPDGGYVGGGMCNDGSPYDHAESVIQRLDADGQLLATWGTDGSDSLSRFDICPSIGPVDTGYINEYLQAIMVLPDGAIIAAGECETALEEHDMHIIRLDSDGMLDTDFGGDAPGATYIDGGSDKDVAFALAHQSDGSIIVAGGNTNGRFLIARLDAETGELDDSFGEDGDGVVRLDVGAGDTFVKAAQVEFDDRIVLVGDSTIAGTSTQIVLRLNADGTLDHSFGTNGRVDLEPSTGNAVVNGLASIGDGRIITAGRATVGAAQRLSITSLTPAAVPQYGAATSRWSDRSDGFFAVCVNGGTTGALVDVGDWPAASTGTCGTTASDDAQWKDVPATAAGVELATWETPSAPIGVAHMRFAFAAASGQALGSYIAPLTFELVPY